MQQFEQQLGVTSTEDKALVAILLGIHWRPLLELPDTPVADLRRALQRSHDALLQLL